MAAAGKDLLLLNYTDLITLVTCYFADYMSHQSHIKPSNLFDQQSDF